MGTNCAKSDIAVAVFDSGIGGLNLLKECVKVLPDAQYYFLADNYNVPYGMKSREELFNLVKSKLDLAADKGVDAAVIACNTATANCIDDLRAVYPFPIVGIQPAIKPAIKLGGRCVVLATPSTVHSSSFANLISRFGNADVVVHPCAGLADYIEENIFTLDKGVPMQLLPEENADSVVLGCTHYIYIKNALRALYNCPIYDGIEGTVRRLMELLGMYDHSGYFLGNDDHFCRKSYKITFLGGNIVKNEQVFNHINIFDEF